MSKVVKVPRGSIYEQFPVGDYNTVEISAYPKEHLPLGKVAISIKVGKRRKLVQGHMTEEPAEDLNGSLYWRYFFTPNNPQKLRSLCLSIDQREQAKKGL
jgi:hypothetical protein